MGHQVQAQFAATGKYTRKLLGRVAQLAAESSPTPMNLSLQRQRLLQRGEGVSSLRWRRKHRIRLALMPSLVRASSQARCRPLMTVSMGTPRAVWVCGSKKISACTTLSAAARSK
jgi:hypothetical protein